MESNSDTHSPGGSASTRPPAPGAVTFLDWSMNSSPPGNAHSMSCGQPYSSSTLCDKRYECGYLVTVKATAERLVLVRERDLPVSMPFAAVELYPERLFSDLLLQDLERLPVNHEVVAFQLTGDHALAQTEAGIDDHLVRAPVERVRGEYNAGGIGWDHQLDKRRDEDIRVVQPPDVSI